VEYWNNKQVSPDLPTEHGLQGQLLLNCDVCKKELSSAMPMSGSLTATENGNHRQESIGAFDGQIVNRSSASRA